MISYYDFEQILKAAQIEGSCKSWSSTTYHLYHGVLYSYGTTLSVNFKGKKYGREFKQKFANSPQYTILPLEVCNWLKTEVGINLYNIPQSIVQGINDSCPLQPFRKYKEVALMVEL